MNRPKPVVVDVPDLRLDSQNPRLPEEIQGTSQEEILKYLYENDVLDELIYSFAENGFFESEPLIILSEDAESKFVVVEGNRRAAALMIFHQLPAAINAEINLPPELELGPDQLKNTRQIPAVEAPDRRSVAAYLGFRHIGGPRKWNPDAKARWIVAQIEDYDGPEDAFRAVGRMVGSNARGVRSAYIAYKIL